MFTPLKNLWSRLRGTPVRDRTEKQKIGDAGELAAAHFLERKHGMKILIRNWRNPKNLREELDIVCRSREGVIVFVEVRTRTAADLERLLGTYASIDKQKKAVLRRGALAYLKSLGPHWRELSYRFDIVVVERATDGVLTPHHFECVPLFPPGEHIAK